MVASARTLLARPAVLSAGWLFLAVNIANGLGFAYQLVMNRLLRPGDFSILVSLFAALIVETQGLQLVQASTAKIVADLRARDRRNEVYAFVVRWAPRIASMAAGLSVLLLAVVALVPTPFPTSTLVMLGVAQVGGALFALGTGVVQGLAQHGMLGALVISQAAVRLIAGVLLVVAGFGIEGAFGGATLGVVVSVVLVAIAVRRLVRRPEGTVVSPPVASVFVGGAGVFLAYAIVVNLDALVAPLLLDRAHAGLYASVVTMGKIALFAPLGLSLFLLERVASLHAHGRPTAGVLLPVLAAVVLVSGAVAVFYAVAPAAAATIVVAPEYVEGATELAPLYGVLGLSSALLGMWAAYFVGTGQLDVWRLFVGAAVLLLVGLSALARDPRTMVLVALAVSAALQCGLVVRVWLVRSDRAGAA
jgi:O-antigen/teichoic acid export membrane protein